jgi:hypothetical protein
MKPGYVYEESWSEDERERRRCVHVEREKRWRDSVVEVLVRVRVVLKRDVVVASAHRPRP